MKKTKIICTMGPNTNDKELLKSLALNGMDIARFNFSHGDYEEQKGRLDLLKQIRKEVGLPIAALLDTKGPEIRTGLLKDNKSVVLKAGDIYTFTTEEIIGDDKRGHINYAGLPADLEIGNKILVDDGLLELEVTGLNDTEISCRVINGGELGMRKGVNVPGVKVNLPAITEKDRQDILFGIEQDFDFIAASFVRSVDAILEIKMMLSKHHSDIRVIAKIENREGVDNIDAIIKAADGIMVARGDLGVEIPAQEVPYIQKMIIKKCNDAFKPVITATQMLDSMIRNPRPTRAEVTDVANAIYDGTDAVMLSGETAAGKYPLEALKMMAQIAESTEEHIDYGEILAQKQSYRKRGISSAVSYATVATAYHMNAAAIITPTMSGYTARLVSKFRPKAEIIGTSPKEDVVRKMQLLWGVRPLKSVEQNVTDDVMDSAVTMAKYMGFVDSGDLAIITAGVPTTNVGIGERGVTNVMRVVTVS
ncbi:pyruvate kinase [Lachnotalea sp. AF33-28]|uniref:pyruvate kinase n=1 Tax=Lachnotalea sp. AF33-28 TaxID=2292046 RepID=UPI000E4F53F6|nr:pyruvate kinase [Lachnotalea sp. AF33-28]RHP31767.1 pyruvate kinase [Lachnotalea sp. AF33-28]